MCQREYPLLIIIKLAINTITKVYQELKRIKLRE